MQMSQQVVSKLHAFLKEVDSQTAHIVNIDGLVDTVLKYSGLLNEVSRCHKDIGKVDFTTPVLVFTEILKQIYSSISCYSFPSENVFSLPWLNISHSLSTVLNAVVKNSVNQTNAVKKRMRYHRQSSRASNSRLSIKHDSDLTAAPIVLILRQQLHAMSNFNYSDEKNWRSISAVSRIFELLVSFSIDGYERKSSSGVTSLASLYSVTAEILEVIMQSSSTDVMLWYPPLITAAICLFSMPFHDSISDLRVPMLRWLTILDNYSKSNLSSRSKPTLDIFIISIGFLIFIYISCNNNMTPASNFYAIQNVDKIIFYVNSFLDSKQLLSEGDSLNLDSCASLLRFISFFIQSIRLNRVKTVSCGANFFQRATGPWSRVNADISTSSGCHCCSLAVTTCSIHLALDLALSLIKAVSYSKGSDSASLVSERSAIQLLLTELVRSGACCCCFKPGNDIVVPLLKTASKKHENSILAVNVCIRVFLDYHPRPDAISQESCPFYFAKDSRRNDILADYVSLPLQIFTSYVKLEHSDDDSSEESCFQIANQILTLTSTSAFSTNSHARRFLFHHLVGPLFDWVLSSCFDQTDLFISRKALPVVLRILEDFLGDKDLNYFADFVSSSRLTYMSRLIEAGNGFCYIIGLIRVMLRCPSSSNLTLNSETISQLEVVKKVAVSTFLSAFYSATKRLNDSLYSTEDCEKLSISCNDLQIMSHCFYLLDESQYFTSAFINQQATECFTTLLVGFDHYVKKRHSESFTGEFIQLFVFVMGSLFRLKSIPKARDLPTLKNACLFSSPHEFYNLLKLSFDSFCSMLSAKPPMIEHWCIIRNYRGLSGIRQVFSSDIEMEGEDEQTIQHTSSVFELQSLIGGNDALPENDDVSTADTDYDADQDEDEDNEYSVTDGTDNEEGDAAYRENVFGSSSVTKSFIFVGPRFYLALELVRTVCKFIRHCRNCIDPSCPTNLAELTCYLEGVLAIIAQAKINSFSNHSIEGIFDLIFSGELRPFLLNNEHNWHTIQHLLLCLLANLGSRHIKPRHLCSLFRMTTAESISLVSAATNCLTKLVLHSDFRAPSVCLRIGSCNWFSAYGEKPMLAPLPVRWQPGKCCFTFCTWIQLESSVNSDYGQHIDNSDPQMFRLCTFGCPEMMTVVSITRKGRQSFEASAEISLNGKIVRRKLHLPFVRQRWHMLALQIRDEIVGNKDQYLMSVTAVLDCEHVSTGTAFWPVDEVPRKETDFRPAYYFSPPVIVIGGSDRQISGTETKMRSLNKDVMSASLDSVLLAGAVVFSSWLEVNELLECFARLPTWLHQPLSSLGSWFACPSMCITPKIIEDDPLLFTQPSKPFPDFLKRISLILRPAMDSSNPSIIAEFVKIAVLQPTSAADNESKSKGNNVDSLTEIKGKIIANFGSPSNELTDYRIECSNFHNSVLQVGGPDFLITWFSSLGSIAHVNTCRQLMISGIEAVLSSIQHPLIYARFVELEGFEMLYQLLMLNTLPNGSSFLNDNLIRILINASLSRSILSSTPDSPSSSFSSPSVLSLKQVKVGDTTLNLDPTARDAGAVVQIPEIWSEILLNANFLTANPQISCWVMIFSTVSLLLSSSNGRKDVNRISAPEFPVVTSTTAQFNQIIFSKMDFSSRCFTIIRSIMGSSFKNEATFTDIVVSSLGDYALALSDSSAVAVVVDFLIALYPLSSFMVDITATDLFPSLLFSNQSVSARSSIYSRLSCISGENSLPATKTYYELTDSKDETTHSALHPKRNSSAPALAALVENEAEPAESLNLPQKQPRSLLKRKHTNIMIRLIGVLDVILQNHPESAYDRLFKVLKPDMFSCFLGGGSEDLLPSVEFSSRLLHTLWQSLSAAHCQVAADVFINKHGPVLISLQLSRALGVDSTSENVYRQDSSDSYRNMLFTSLSSYYYESMCRNVSMLEQLSIRTSGLTIRQNTTSRSCACKCESMMQSVKSSCPAKAILCQWWTVPAFELAVSSLYTFRNSYETRQLLRMIIAEFMLTYNYAISLAGSNTGDVESSSRVWNLIGTKLELMWLLICSSLSSLGEEGSAIDCAQHLHFDCDVELLLTCALTFMMTIISSVSSLGSIASPTNGETHKRREKIETQSQFVSIMKYMTSLFPELAIPNHWLLAALQQFERVSDLATDSTELRRTLPVAKKPKNLSTSAAFSQSVSFTVSGIESEEEPDEYDEDLLGTSQCSILPSFERAMLSILHRNLNIAGNFVELIAAHIRRWPQASNSGDLAKATLLFVSRHLEAKPRIVVGNANCLISSCAAAVLTDSVDMLFIAEIIHDWISVGSKSTDLFETSAKQWNNIQSACYLTTELNKYEAEKGPFLLPTQRTRLKEIAGILPPSSKLGTVSILSPALSDSTISQRMRHCCEYLMPNTDKLFSLSQASQNLHHKKRIKLTLPNLTEPSLRVRLRLIEIVRRFAHPSAPLGDSSTASTLFPDEWELDAVECTLGVYAKLRRQALSLPAGKVYRQYRKHTNEPNRFLDDSVSLSGPSSPANRVRSNTVPDSPGSEKSKVSTRSTFLSCDCNENRDYPAVIVRDWTYLTRPVSGQPTSPLSGFLSTVVHLLSSSSVPKEESNFRIDLSCQCTLVTPSAQVDGEMLVTEQRVVFLSQSATIEDIYRQYLFDLHSGVPVLITFPLSTVTAVYLRRYLLKENSLEVYLTSGKAYFFAFNPDSVEIFDASGNRKSETVQRLNPFEICERVRSVLLAKSKLSSVFPTPNELQLKWLKGQLTNFEYLTLLNRAGGRSHNEMMQYPVFPWVLSDFQSSSIDLTSPSFYRDLRKQIPLQPDLKDGEEKVLLRYTQLEAEGSEPYHFPSLYSNSGITAHYLVRLPPFTQACLNYQDGNFDIPDRTFSSLAATWSIADIKELLPEFFYLPEFLTNFCNLNLGVCQSGARVWDVGLPPWAGNSPRRFVLVHRQALEAQLVRAALPKWIDLIFGFRQNGKGALEAMNIFHPSTYFSSAMHVDIQALLADPVLFAARQAQIRTYGQIPRQLFEYAHPGYKKSKSDITSSEVKSDMFGDDVSLSGLSIGNYAGSHSKLVCVWHYEVPIDQKSEQIAEFRFIDPSSIVVLSGQPNHVAALLSIKSAVKHKKRIILPTSTPAAQSTIPSNWFTVKVHNGVASGFEVANAKKVYGLSTTSDIASGDFVVSQFHATSQHKITFGPLHSQLRSALFFGTSVGVILVYMLHLDEIDLTSNRPEGRLPNIGKMPVRVLCAHETAAAISSMAISDEFKMLVVGTSDGKCIYYDLNSLSFVRQVTVTHNDNVLSSAITHIAISSTMGDVAVCFESEHLAMFSVNGSIIGQTVGPRNVVSLDFSSCDEGTSVNTLIVCSQKSPELTFYCTWNLRKVRTVRLDHVAMVEQVGTSSQSNSSGKKKSENKQTQRSDNSDQILKACYCRPDSKIIAVVRNRSISFYANASSSVQALGNYKNTKCAILS